MSDPKPSYDQVVWQRLWDVFYGALEIDASEREGYLNEACASDEELGLRVRELLASHDHPSILDNSPFLTSLADSDRSHRDGGQLGPQEGSLLANRFEIIRILGRGGMATIYEALDLDLGTKVALKMLRNEISSDPEALERFNREVNLARRVTHPNVCRIFDLFHHDNLSFITMELLEGETLYDLIKRRGSLPVSECLTIIEQLSAALLAAHELGIIHRDLKPTNIMLVSENAHYRAVVTDFGMAVATAEFRLTGEGKLLGTPEYMSPEQLRGGSISPATDVYALGLLMYEMLTGKQPFQGDTPASIAYVRLHTPAPSPRKHIIGLERKWEGTILRCLEQSPKDRFQSPADALAVLKGAPISIHFFTERKKRLMRFVLPLFLIALIGVFSIRSSQINESQIENFSFEKRDLILVSAFENKTGDTSLDDVLEYALGRELNNSKHLNVVSRERIIDALKLMGKPHDTKIDSNIGREVCLRDGAIRAMIRGRIEKLGGNYVIGCEIVDPTRNIAMAGFNVEADSQNEILNSVRRLSGQLRIKLGEQVSQIKSNELKLDKVTTPSLRAVQLYSKADILILNDQQAAAEELLREAIAMDPNFASAYMHLAWAIFNQGHKDYLPYAEKALQLSNHVSEREKYFIRASYFDLTRKWDEAVANYQILIESYPDYNWPYGNLIGIFTNELFRAEDAAPYVVRFAAQRPNDMGVNRGCALFFAELNYWKESEVCLKRASSLAGRLPKNDAARVSVEGTIDFVTMHRSWISGDVSHVLNLLERWTERIARGDPTTTQLKTFFGMYGQTLGRFKDSERIYRHEQNDENRNFRIRGLNLNRTHISQWRPILMAHPFSSPPGAGDAYLLARAGMMTEARKILNTPNLLYANEGSEEAAEAEITLRSGNVNKAIALLKKARHAFRIRSYWSEYYPTSGALADTYLKMGNPELALRILEDASAQKNRILYAGKNSWLENQLKLSGLYRQLGRQSEAERIEKELRHLLIYSDSNYWVIQELNRRAKSTKLAAN